MAINALHGKIMGDKELTVKIVEEKPPMVTRIDTQQQTSAVKYVKVERPTGVIRKKRPRKTF
jgi:hypothetical protein